MKVIDKREIHRAIPFEDLPVGQCFIDPDYGDELCLKYDDVYEMGLDNVLDLVENVSIYCSRDDMVLPVDTEIHIIK